MTKADTRASLEQIVQEMQIYEDSGCYGTNIKQWVSRLSALLTDVVRAQPPQREGVVSVFDVDYWLQELEMAQFGKLGNTVEANSNRRIRQFIERLIATVRAQPQEEGQLDRATIEYIHNEWEFHEPERTEEEFDDWLHGLIREARKRESAPLPSITPDQGRTE